MPLGELFQLLLQMALLAFEATEFFLNARQPLGSQAFENLHQAVDVGASLTNLSPDSVLFVLESLCFAIDMLQGLPDNLISRFNRATHPTDTF